MKRKIFSEALLRDLAAPQRTTPELIRRFQNAVWRCYEQVRRDFPWRATTDPYAVLVSEVMLQQTQTHRVLPKYESFLGRFPTVEALAASTLTDVLEEWQGLGYNRRGKNLLAAAKEIVRSGTGVPVSEADLRKLPGVGIYTARAVLAFAFNVPTVFIETNIRAVYLHAFFQQHKGTVSDKDLEPLIAATVSKDRVREWYYALMDVGVLIKRAHPGIGQRSAHHRVQAPFKGSLREARGAILRALTLYRELTRGDLQKRTALDRTRFSKALEQLKREGFVRDERRRVRLG